jgi:protein-S-isoprenylcysteine O-methyltransferase Ste14
MASLRRSIVVSLLFTLFGGPGISLLFIPFWITRFHIPPQQTLCQTLFAGFFIFLGLTPALESVNRFIYVGRGTLMPTVPTEILVTSGLYRYVRNPMYLGVLITLIGECILFHRLEMLIYTAIWWLIIHCFVCFYEERTLRKRYAGQYQTYCANVRRWIPCLTPWQGR